MHKQEINELTEKLIKERALVQSEKQKVATVLNHRKGNTIREFLRVSPIPVKIN